MFGDLIDKVLVFVLNDGCGELGLFGMNIGTEFVLEIILWICTEQMLKAEPDKQCNLLGLVTVSVTSAVTVTYVINTNHAFAFGLDLGS